MSNFGRPGKAFATGTYAGARTYSEDVEDIPGKPLPKTGAHAAAGFGYARAEWSIFDAEAKGPNASAAASVGAVGARAFAKAELASASGSAGPVNAKVGLAVDTGIDVGLTGIEAKVLGTGFSLGRKISVSILGNEIGFNKDWFE